MISVTASAGPSSANLGHGFDVLAVALRSRSLPRDRVTVERAKRWEVIVEGPTAKGIPTKPSANVAVAAARALTRKPLRIRIWKGIPSGSGLGSSAASAAATVAAVNRLLKLELSDEALLAAAAEGERPASGVSHSDNVGAALFGGLICTAATPPSWPIPRTVAFALAIPGIQRVTKRMRRVVPATWPRALHIRESGNAMATAMMLHHGKVSQIARTVRGSVVERARASMIPGYSLAVKAAERAGAPAVTISGSGPTLIAIVDTRAADPQRVADSMIRAFARAGVPGRAVVARTGEGAKIE